MNEWMNAFSFEMNCYTLITVGELRVSGLAHVRGACALRKCPRDSPVRIFINITDISKKKNNNKHFIWLDVIITINGSWIAANSFAVINVRVYYCMRIPNHGWTYLLWLFIIESWTGKHTRMNICWSMQESGDVWSVRGKWKTELNCGSNPIMGWYWMRFVRHMLYYSLHFFFLLPYREWQCVTLLFIISTVDLMENIIWLERRGAVDAFAWISIPHRLWM